MISYGIKKIEISPLNGNEFTEIHVDECDSLQLPSVKGEYISNPLKDIQEYVDYVRVSNSKQCSVFPFLNPYERLKPIELPFEDKGTFRNENKHRQSCLKSRKNRKRRNG